jgi:(p)ppGpp synthase/HD superfamily hydrolase
MNDAVDHARSIAQQAHNGQTKKSGDLVIDHVTRVASKVEGREERIVAWLHDVVEKSPDWTLERLRQEGFDDQIVRAVDALTKRPGEDHAALVRRASTNRLAHVVKLADLADNLAEAERSGRDGSKYQAGLLILQKR